MKLKMKKLLFFTTVLGLTGAGIQSKLCKEQSLEFSKHTNHYIQSFEEDDFLIAAHRGFSSLEVENSMEAISLAASKPYIDYIEIDARLTADGKIILSHNNDIILDPQLKISVSDYPYDLLSENTFCYFNNPIFVNLQTLFNSTDGEILRTRNSQLAGSYYQLPDLLEGIRACQDKKILLDLKFEKNTKNFVSELKNELNGISTENITFQSSDLVSLLYLKDQCPDFACLAIIQKMEQLDYIPLFENLGIRKNLIQEELVKEAVNEGKNVSIWTVNHPEEVETVVEQLGPSYQDVIYVTDYPDMVSSYLHDASVKIKKTTP